MLMSARMSNSTAKAELLRNFDGIIDARWARGNGSLSPLSTLVRRWANEVGSGGKLPLPVPFLRVATFLINELMVVFDPERADPQ